MDGRQGGDLAKLASALVELARRDEPPARFAAGADAVQVFENKAGALLAQADAFRTGPPHSLTTRPERRYQPG